MAELSKTQLTLKFREGDTFLAVAVKIPGELPRVLPVTLEDVEAFMREEFPAFWKTTEERVRNELARAI